MPQNVPPLPIPYTEAERGAPGLSELAGLSLSFQLPRDETEYIRNDGSFYLLLRLDYFPNFL